MILRCYSTRCILNVLNKGSSRLGWRLIWNDTVSADLDWIGKSCLVKPIPLQCATLLHTWRHFTPMGRILRRVARCPWRGHSGIHQRCDVLLSSVEDEVECPYKKQGTTQGYWWLVLNVKNKAVKGNACTGHLFGYCLKYLLVKKKLLAITSNEELFFVLYNIVRNGSFWSNVVFEK